MTQWLKRLREWRCSWFHSVPTGDCLNYISTRATSLIHSKSNIGRLFEVYFQRGRGYRSVQKESADFPTISSPWTLQCPFACKLYHASFSLEKGGDKICHYARHKSYGEMEVSLHSFQPAVIVTPGRGPPVIHWAPEPIWRVFRKRKK